MNKNYMEEVSKVLGVEIGEYFCIKDFDYNPCYLSEEGLIDRSGA